MSRLTFILVILCHLAAGQSNDLTLVIQVRDIEQPFGTMRCCLVQEKGEYLSSRCDIGQYVDVTSEVLEIQFDGLPSGTYCVTLYHDQDNNHKLNTDGPFGLPSEPYGFSNNPRSWFGPPKYKACTFELMWDRVIEIDL